MISRLFRFIIGDALQVPLRQRLSSTAILLTSLYGIFSALVNHYSDLPQITVDLSVFVIVMYFFSVSDVAFWEPIGISHRYCPFVCLFSFYTHYVAVQRRTWWWIFFFYRFLVKSTERSKTPFSKYSSLTLTPFS